MLWVGRKQQGRSQTGGLRVILQCLKSKLLFPWMQLINLPGLIKALF